MNDYSVGLPSLPALNPIDAEVSYVSNFFPQYRQTFRRRIRPSRSGSVCVV
jgi:hypothetical protein